MVASDYDLGDSMTKKSAESREGLMKFLRCWHWCIAFDPSFTAAKRNKRAGWTAVQKVDDALQKLVNAALAKNDVINAEMLHHLLQCYHESEDGSWANLLFGLVH